MRILLVILLSVAIFGCGGSLTEDQREALKEEKKAKKIKRVSEEQIYERALQNGRQILKEMNEGTVISTIENEYKATILRVNDSTPGLAQIERELWETYKSSDWTNVKAEDQENVQKNGQDFLIYTLPVLGEEEDSVFLSALWMVRMKRKEIVLSL